MCKRTNNQWRIAMGGTDNDRVIGIVERSERKRRNPGFRGRCGGC